jgi:hypothetical protein
MPYDFDVPSELRLDPMLATAGVPLVDPEMLYAGKLLVSAVEQQGYAGAIPDVCCVHFGTKDEAASVDENVRLRPLTRLAPSFPRTPPTPVVRTDWLSMIAALGSGLRPTRMRSCSRRIALRCSHVPSIRHRRK